MTICEICPFVNRFHSHCHNWDIMDALDQHIWLLPNPPKTAQKFTNALVEVWQDNDHVTISRLIKNMTGAVERALRHAGVIPTVNVSFQYDCMNGRNFGANPYLDYHFFGLISRTSRQMVFPVRLGQFCTVKFQTG